jgi:hypothetical protein
VEHKAGEGQEMQTRYGLGQPFVVAGQTAEARRPAEGALRYQRRGRSTNLRLASGSLTTSSRIPWASASEAGVSPV